MHFICCTSQSSSSLLLLLLLSSNASPRKHFLSLRECATHTNNIRREEKEGWRVRRDMTKNAINENYFEKLTKVMWKKEYLQASRFCTVDATMWPLKPVTCTTTQTFLHSAVGRLCMEAHKMLMTTSTHEEPRRPATFLHVMLQKHGNNTVL